MEMKALIQELQEETHTHKEILPSACIVLQNNETVSKY
jgi:hypothetical protein